MTPGPLHILWLVTQTRALHPIQGHNHWDALWNSSIRAVSQAVTVHWPKPRSSRRTRTYRAGGVKTSAWATTTVVLFCTTLSLPPQINTVSSGKSSTRGR